MATELTMKQLHPFWGRISLLPSPVDEETRESGVIVPLSYDGHEVPRGVIVEVDRTTVEESGDAKPWYDRLDPGTVVYYKGGTKIGDLILIEVGDILAIEGA